MQTIKQLFSDAFGSRKFIITLVGLICLVVVKIFGGMTNDMFAALFTALCGVYTIGQGIADGQQPKG